MTIKRNAPRRTAVLAAYLAATHAVCAQSATQSAPGQPQSSAALNSFKIVGNSIVSAQQLFLGTLDKVYIVDKVENNPTQINGHPAWAAEYSISGNKGRPMDIVTNSFCAGGSVLGNGTWVNAGGNQAVTWGGLTASSQTGGPPYNDPDGGQSLRLLDPCDDASCNWVVHGDNAMTTRRWYPSVETLADGSVFIIGGDQWGGYVNNQANNNPTYEFFPSRGPPVALNLLETTLPANLFPITMLLPSGRLFLQLNWATAVLDLSSGKEYALNDVPDAVRTYPASAGTAMLPLTPANNWTATILFCGGTNLQPDQWVTNWNIAQYPASSSCVKITPDMSGSYVQDDPLLEGRVMNSLVLLPTQKIFAVNGANTGTSGYGNDSWAIGQSYADHPILQPALYDPSKPAGQRWTEKGLNPSTVIRMYHSSATLLADGSIFVSGSNPNGDYNVGPNVAYPTEYRVEYFYPYYYNSRRPMPQGLPTTISYGGPYFNVSLTSDDLSGNMTNLKSTTVVVVRTGFSTHALSMGQRLVQLNNTYTAYANGSAVLHVSQMPPNPSILAPGPALLFVVVNDVPSIGVQVMVGSGKVETQPVNAVVDLLQSSIPTSSGGSSSNAKQKSAAFSVRMPSSNGKATQWVIVVSLALSTIVFSL